MASPSNTTTTGDINGNSNTVGTINMTMPPPSVNVTVNVQCSHAPKAKIKTCQQEFDSETTVGQVKQEFNVPPMFSIAKGGTQLESPEKLKTLLLNEQRQDKLEIEARQFASPIVALDTCTLRNMISGVVYEELKGRHLIVTPTPLRELPVKTSVLQQLGVHPVTLNAFETARVERNSQSFANEVGVLHHNDMRIILEAAICGACMATTNCDLFNNVSHLAQRFGALEQVPKIIKPTKAAESASIMSNLATSEMFKSIELYFNLKDIRSDLKWATSDRKRRESLQKRLMIPPILDSLLCSHICSRCKQSGHVTKNCTMKLP